MSTIHVAKETDLPFVWNLHGLEPDSFIAYYRENKNKIDSLLLSSGAVKFSGVRIDSTETFQYIVDAISDKFLNYIDGTSPRTKLTGHVYTSTEYDASQRITMHNELSYSAKWPNKLFFSCLLPAETGGETLLADGREMVQRMNQEIVAEIEKRGVVYIRNLHGGNGVGTSWKAAFETEDKAVLENYCKALDIQLEWHDDDNVRLKQFSPGILEHRVTKEKVWFNQIDQFHPYQLGQELYDAMNEIYASPEEFPTYVTFGDGGTISEQIVEEILKTSESITLAPPWQKNELLIVENVLVSHGRNSYTGQRKVLVAMSE
jgi:hypothetical protein